jgi:glucose/arabinose dehydrogenase
MRDWVLWEQDMTRLLWHQKSGGGERRADFGSSSLRVGPQLGLSLVLVLSLLGGCAPTPRMLPVSQQIPIDRSLLQYPAGFTVEPFIRGLSGPSAIAWDEDGSLLVAESGGYRDEPRIVGFKKDGTLFTLYPYNRKIPVEIARFGFRLYGPIGGMIVYKGKIYVSHRDENGLGQITALDHEGGHTTIIAHLPAVGDYSVTDMAIDPRLGRLFFGVGAATNSGVVGLDNFEWVQDSSKVHDKPWARLHLRGYRFDSPNPFSGLFGPADIAVTAPFQAFNVSNETEVNADESPNAAIYSCSPNGGDLKVEAHGIRYPRGIAFNGYSFYFTNDGMELRGTRPVKNDPDALLRLIPGGTWYGWPDYTADLQPVWDDKFQPPEDMIANTGYKRVLFVIDQQATNVDPKNQSIQLLEPNRETLLKGVFSPLSGAAKLDFAPGSGPFKQFRGKAIVALSGDRAPFATSGNPIIGPIGYKVVMVDTDTRQISDFVRNIAGGPASRIDSNNLNLLERPIDVKFGPDGSLYILDTGHLRMHSGREEYELGTGKIFRLVPEPQPMMYH